MKLQFLLSSLLFGMAVMPLSSCGDDNDLDSKCELCATTKLNSSCVVSGQAFHCGTSMAQYLSSTRGSYLNIHIHKDEGGVRDYHNIDLSISATTGPSINDIEVGQALLLEEGTDRVSYSYDTTRGQVTHDRYVSGRVTCTRKRGTEATLTFTHVVLRNAQDGTQVLIDGTFVCDQYRH